MLNFWLLVLSSFLPRAEAAMPVINAPAAIQQAAAQEEKDPAEQARLVEAVVEELIENGQDDLADEIRQSGVIPANWGPYPPYAPRPYPVPPPPYYGPGPYFRPPPPVFLPPPPPVYYPPPPVYYPPPPVFVPVVPVVPAVPVPVAPPCGYYSCY